MARLITSQPYMLVKLRLCLLYAWLKKSDRTRVLEHFYLVTPHRGSLRLKKTSEITDAPTPRYQLDHCTECPVQSFLKHLQGRVPPPPLWAGCIRGTVAQAAEFCFPGGRTSKSRRAFRIRRNTATSQMVNAKALSGHFSTRTLRLKCSVLVTFARHGTPCLAETRSQHNPSHKRSPAGFYRPARAGPAVCGARRDRRAGPGSR